MVSKEIRVKSDHLVLLVILVDLERKVIKDNKEEMEHLAAKENGEKMAFKEKEDSLVPVDSEVEWDEEEAWVSEVPKETLVSQDHLVREENRE